MNNPTLTIIAGVNGSGKTTFETPALNQKSQQKLAFAFGQFLIVGFVVVGVVVL